MPANVVSAARKAGVSVRQLESLEEVLSETDVLYVTRIQKERFGNEAEWQKVKDAYRIDHAVLSRAKEDMIVMHPLPRVNGKYWVYVSVTVLTSSLEIDPEVDFDSRRAVYFRQMRYGLFVRCLNETFLGMRDVTPLLRFAWHSSPVFWERYKYCRCTFVRRSLKLLIMHSHGS